jgi:DNA repair protein RecO (recombination protein O)
VPLATSRSIVLQGFAYGDTSKILRLLTRGYGLRSVIARGAIRPKSRFGGILEPFTEGEARMYLSEGRDLHTLAGFDLVRSRQRLGRDFAGFAAASLLTELALRFSTEEPNPALFDALSGGLDALLDSAPPRRDVVVVAAVWTMVGLLGYRPEADACVRCGRALEPDEPARFDAESGGVACTACRPAGRMLDPITRSELSAVLGGGVPDRLATPGAHRALLRAYLTRQMTQHAPLKSLELFLDPPV